MIDKKNTITIKTLFYSIIMFSSISGLSQETKGRIFFNSGDTLEVRVYASQDLYDEFKVKDISSGDTRTISPDKVKMVEYDDAVYYSKEYQGQYHLYKAIVLSNVASLYSADGNSFYLEKDTLSLVPKPETTLRNDKLIYTPRHLRYLSFVLSDCLAGGSIDDNMGYNSKDMERLLLKYLKCRDADIYYRKKSGFRLATSVIGGSSFSQINFDYKGGRLVDMTRYTEYKYQSIGFEAGLQFNLLFIGHNNQVVFSPVMRFSEYSQDWADSEFESGNSTIKRGELVVRLGYQVFILPDRLHVGFGVMPTFLLMDNARVRAIDQDQEYDFEYLIKSKYTVLNEFNIRFDGYYPIEPNSFTLDFYTNIGYSFNSKLGGNWNLWFGNPQYTDKVKDVNRSVSETIGDLVSNRLGSTISLSYKLF